MAMKVFVFTTMITISLAAVWPCGAAEMDCSRRGDDRPMWGEMKKPGMTQGDVRRNEERWEKKMQMLAKANGGGPMPLPTAQQPVVKVECAASQPQQRHARYRAP